MTDNNILYDCGVVGRNTQIADAALPTVRSPVVSSLVSHLSFYSPPCYASDEDVHGNTLIATQPPTARSSTPPRARPAQPPPTAHHGGERTGEPRPRWWLLHRDAIAAAGCTAGDAGAADRHSRWACSARHHHVHTQ